MTISKATNDLHYICIVISSLYTSIVRYAKAPRSCEGFVVDEPAAKIAILFVGEKECKPRY